MLLHVTDGVFGCIVLFFFFPGSQGSSNLDLWFGTQSLMPPYITPPELWLPQIYEPPTEATTEPISVAVLSQPAVPGLCTVNPEITPQKLHLL